MEYTVAINYFICLNNLLFISEKILIGLALLSFYKVAYNWLVSAAILATGILITAI